MMLMPLSIYEHKCFNFFLALQHHQKELFTHTIHRYAPQGTIPKNCKAQFAKFRKYQCQHNIKPRKICSFWNNIL